MIFVFVSVNSLITASPIEVGLSDLANKEAIRLNLNFLMHSNIFVFSIGNVSCTIGDVFISNLRIIPIIGNKDCWELGDIRHSLKIKGTFTHQVDQFPKNHVQRQKTGSKSEMKVN